MIVLSFYLLTVIATQEDSERGKGKNGPNRKPVSKINFDNADLQSIKVFFEDLIDTHFQNAGKPEKIKRKALKSMKKADQFMPKAEKLGCLVESPDFTPPPVAPCAVQGINSGATTLSDFVDAYFDPSVSKCAKNVKKLKKKFGAFETKLGLYVNKGTVDGSLDACDSGTCFKGRCIYDLAAGTVFGMSRAIALEDAKYTNVVKFVGIKFANSNRFERPVAVTSFDEIADLSIGGKTCAGAGPVDTGSESLPTSTETSEDCLYINIYVKKDALADGADMRRVLSWIHGGTFNYGGVDVIYEDPSHLVDEQDIIVAKMNYRLGPFGNWWFDAEVGGNAQTGFGFLDQRMGLQFIHENIAKFNGDSAEITLGGGSAGGYSVLYHLSHVDSHAFFKNVLVIGPPNIKWWSAAEASQVYSSMAVVLGCSTAETFTTDLVTGDLLTCLQGVPIETLGVVADQVGLLFAQFSLTKGLFSQIEGAFGPNIDGITVLDDPLTLLHAKGADIQTKLGAADFYIHENGRNEARSMTESLFGSEVLMRLIFGNETYDAIWIEGTEDIVVPYLAHNGIMDQWFLSRTETPPTYNGLDQLGCEIDAEAGMMFTECKDAMEKLITSLIWTCSTKHFMQNYIGDNLNIFATQLMVGYPGPDAGATGTKGQLEPFLAQMRDCYMRGGDKSCHIVGQAYFFGESETQGIDLTENELAFGLSYRTLYAGLIKGDATTLSSYEGGMMNDIALVDGALTLTDSDPFPNSCPLYDEVDGYLNF